MEPHHAVTQPNDVLAHMISLTASRSHIKAYQRCNHPSLLTIVAQWLEHSTRSRRVVGGFKFHLEL